MNCPSASKPKPSVIDLTERGATLLLASATVAPPASSRRRHAQDSLRCPCTPGGTSFGSAVQDGEVSQNGLALRPTLPSFVAGTPRASRCWDPARLEGGSIAVAFALDVERPQDLAHPIKAVEPVAIVVPEDVLNQASYRCGRIFLTLSIRMVTARRPYAICIDDRPWVEARSTASPTTWCAGRSSGSPGRERRPA